MFKTAHNLVLRQEQLSKNRLAQDTYWTNVRRGYGAYFRLEKQPDQDTFRCAIAPGTSSLRAQAVPNKADDLGNKIVEALMVDLPAPDPSAETDAEEAERAAELAKEFLTQDGGEQGTRDASLFWRALDGAYTRSATYLHPWTDPTGGGWIPLQLKAHPQAQDPTQPEMAMDAMGQPVPTVDPILRYVATDEQGNPTQFVDDPSQAGRQWVPKIRVDLLGREHVRLYPETADVADAEKAIVVYFLTVGEAKRRWPETVGQMDDGAIGTLCDWTPLRHLQLLPPALRSRWRMKDGEQADKKGTANDERVLFYYAVYQRPVPDHPHGACVYVSGKDEGTILKREPWVANVPHPEGGTETRCLSIPLVPVSLVLDADDKDPTGRPPIERVGGASAALSQLGQAYLDTIDINLHPAVFTPSTSPVSGDDVADSRASGSHVAILTKADEPFYEEQRQLPTNFLNVMESLKEDMNSAIGTSKPAMGADSQQEVSGVAREKAIQQSNVSLGRAQDCFHEGVERFWRIKLELAQKDFGVPQMIRYAGEDGSYKQEWFTGADFAQVTKVKVRPGSGTMMAPQQKVQYILQMRDATFVSPDDAADAAKPTFASTLGLPDDPHQQRIERQVGAWLKGVPSPEWIQERQAYDGQMQQFQQVQAQEQQAAAEHAQTSQSAAVHGAPAAPPAPPQQIAPPQAPWSPFAPLPMDDEPMIAALRQRRLSKLMASARFVAQPPEWQSCVFDAYNAARTAVAASQQPVLPKGVNVAVKASPENVGQAEQNAAHPPKQKAA